MNTQLDDQRLGAQATRTAGSPPNGMQPESLLREYSAVILRGKWTILFAVVTLTSLVAFYTFRTEPVYEASSLILIDMKGNEGGVAMFDITGAATASKITNELEILKSNSNAEAVAGALIDRRHLDRESTKMIQIILSGEEGISKDSLAGSGEVVSRLSKVVDFIPVRESDIIRITARSTVPEEAALIANVYTEVYTARNLDMSRQRSQAVREFLQNQYQSKRAVLDAAENALQGYMKISGVVSLDAEANKVVDQLSQLEAQRDGMQVERSSRMKILASYKDELASQEPKAALAMGESNDSYIRLLQEQLAKLEVQRDVVIAQNPNVVNSNLYAEKLREINSQIGSLKKTLTERTQTFLNAQLPGRREGGDGNASFLGEVKQKIIEQQIELGGLDARVKAMNTVIADYEKRFNAIPQKSIELAKLQRARLSSEKLYLFVEEKYNEAAIKEKSEFGYVNIVDPAVVPNRPVSPKVPQNLVLGLLLGLGLGVGIVFVRISLDTRIRTPRDLRRCGFVPLSSVGLMDGEVKKIEEELAKLNGSNKIDPHLVAHHRPMAPVAESYRHLKTNLQHIRVDVPLRCLVVTSANPKEGKTTTLANLGVSFSQSEKKVLLVDGDLRRPSLHAYFGLKHAPGLTDVLYGKVTLTEAVKTNVVPNLDVLASGSGCPNPAEALGSNKMKELIAQLKQKYDIVLIDSPPLLAVTDASVLATETDGVLLVASSGTTRAPELDHIAESLSTIGIKMMGVLLNKFDIRDVYGSYYASYHHGYYGYESGYYRKDTRKQPHKSLTKHS
jgi:capsular exopolysaccharide synthesis family protein